MPADTPTALVARRIRTVLVRARAAHEHARQTAAAAYAKPVAPPGTAESGTVASHGPGGAA